MMVTTSGNIVYYLAADVISLIQVSSTIRK